jgi:elongation factor 1-beta
MEQQFDYATPAGLGKLNGFLADKSYISGYQPTSEDARVYAELAKSYAAGPDKKFPHVFRFFNHIASFSEEERAKFPHPAAQPSTSGSAGAPAESKKEEPKAEAAAGGDDDFDVFGEMSEEEKKAEEDRAAAAKSSKPVPVQKSNIILDVKVWDDTTDLVKLEELVRSIEIEGCTWGPSKLVEVAYGVKKLQISTVVIDDLVSTEDLEEKIMAFEDYVQSVDIAAFVRV